MNKLLEKQSRLLADTFNDYANFDFHKELEKVVDEHNIMNGVSTEQDVFTAEKLAILVEAGIEITPLVPLFDKQGKSLVLKSKRFFEIIRYSLALSSFAKGVDQFSASKKISQIGQQQFSVFAYYSSIFQLLSSFLCLHGILYIPKSFEGIQAKTVEITRQENGSIKEIDKFTSTHRFVKGIFSPRRNEWAFSYVGMNHRDRWKHFADLLKKYIQNNWERQIPRGVVDFWGYMKVLSEYKKKFYKNHQRYSIQFSNKKEFTRTLTECYFLPVKIRHQKIYENRHHDLMSHAYWRRNMMPPADFKRAELMIFHNCCKDLLLWQYNNLKDTVECTRQLCRNDDTYYHGLNAISANPYVNMQIYLLPLIKDNKDILEIDKGIPIFLEMFLS